MAYERHQFGKIYNSQLQEMDAELKKLSENQANAQPSTQLYRSNNILNFEKSNDNERILDNGNVITYDGRVSWWFDIDPEYEEGEYCFWIGDDIGIAVYDNAMLVFYSNKDKKDSSTFISKTSISGTGVGDSRKEAVKVTVPRGCECVGITGMISSSAGSIYTGYTKNGVPQIMLSKKFLPYEPYYLENKQHEISATRIYWLGDSIMAGLYCNTTIAKKIDEKYGTCSVNVAVSGSQIFGGGIASQLTTNKIPLYEPDVIIFDGGANDSGVVYGDGTNSHWALHAGSLETALNTPPSMSTSYGTSTCVASFEDLAQKLKNKYPNAKLVYVVTHYCAISARKYTDQRDVLDAYSALAHKWGMEVIDMRDQINAIIDNSFTSNGTVADGTHPTDDAHYKYYIPKIRQKLLELIP